MSRQVEKKYDAFISYRHSELDSFVAETLHHELEKFRLPRNIVKKRGKDAKKKITRVFRDRDELPISPNLSEPIAQALQVADFLIVICTPRLCQSIWCMSEIDTFISMHGRERVLAVLAEGEPKDSFPPQLTRAKKKYMGQDGQIYEGWVNVEPLAADVRGNSKNEIKKKIKEEVLRLAAPMFECTYDEIKQRHKEEKTRIIIELATGVGLIGLAIGGIGMYQANTIKRQGEKIQYQYEEINAQYEEIQAQYAANLVKEAEITGIQVDSYLKQGRVDKATELVRDLVFSTDSLDEVPTEVEEAERNMIAKVLRVYDNNNKVSPYTNIKMSSDIVKVLVDANYEYFTIIDAVGKLEIYGTEDLKRVYEVQTAGFETYEKFIGFYNSDFYYVDKAGIHCVDYKNGTERWFGEKNGVAHIAMAFNSQQVVAYGGTNISIFDMSSGNEVYSTELWADDLYKSIRLINISSDNTKMFVVSYDLENGSTLSTWTYPGMSGMTNISEINLGDANVNCTCYSSQTNLLIVSQTDFNQLADITDNNSAIVAYNPETLEVVWKKSVQYSPTEMYDYAGNIFTNGSGIISFLNPADGSTIKRAEFSEGVTDFAVSNEEKLILLFSNGSYRYETVNFEFADNGYYDIATSNYEDVLFASKYTLVLPVGSNTLNIYTHVLSDQAVAVENSEEIEKYTEKLLKFEKNFYSYDGKYSAQIKSDGIYVYEVMGEGSEAVYNEIYKYLAPTSYVNKVCYDNSERKLFIMNYDNSVEIYDLENETVLTTIEGNDDLAYTAYYDNLNEDYFVLFSYDGIVINKHTYQVAAIVNGYAGYANETNEFIIREARNTESVYHKIKFFSYDELKAMLK